MSWALAALQVVLAGTLFLAAVGKLLRSEEFVAALRLSHLSDGVVSVLALLVPALEAGFAAWLILASPTWLAAAFGATVALLTVFTSWMVWVRARRLHVRCGCFGPNGGEVGAATIGRNLGLIVLAGLGWALSFSVASRLEGPSLWMALIVIAYALSITMISALRFAWPHFTLTDDRLRVGGEAGGN
jgi:hypothetical protein